MERKTLEQIMQDELPVGLYVLRGDKRAIIKAIRTYAEQEVENAIKTTLILAG